ncbi:hypothetical protein [Paenibacillus sp. IITD108]|uniref:hypothetical protein n=1 Tax=Paenibacillus sp. IITD108 TaxID=3116649 RepID=UPI002F421F92
MYRVIAALVISAIFLAGCAESTESFQGNTWEIGTSSVVVDCSDEVNKGKKGPINAIGYGCSVEYTSNTTFKDVNGKSITINDLIPGSEVKVVLSKSVNIRRNIESKNPKPLIAKEIVLLKQADMSSRQPFDFKRDEVSKATIYIGGGSNEVIAEIEQTEQLNKLSELLHHAPPYSGAAPADWNYTIAIESKDGSERVIVVTGNGHVFIDESTKRAYSLDKEKFNEFVSGFQNK